MLFAYVNYTRQKHMRKAYICFLQAFFAYSTFLFYNKHPEGICHGRGFIELFRRDISGKGCVLHFVESLIHDCHHPFETARRKWHLLSGYATAPVSFPEPQACVSIPLPFPAWRQGAWVSYRRTHRFLPVLQ